MPDDQNFDLSAELLSHPTIIRIRGRFAGEGIRAARFRDQINVIVPTGLIHDVLLFLRDDEHCRYDMLCDLFGIDYFDYPHADARFAVVYNLTSTTLNQRVFIRTTFNPTLDTIGTEDDPALHVPSCCDIWPGAEWNERETFDMFGIHFDNHPDHRRILTYESFPAYPLRKDYPLIGRGERDNFEVINRDST